LNFEVILPLIPPFLAIGLALFTKEVYSSLLISILSAELILFNGDIILALGGVESLIISLFNEGWIVKTLFFALFVGSIIHLLVDSNGIKKFIIYLTKKHKFIKNKKTALLFGYFVGLIIFIESSITSLMVGTLLQPFSKKYKISKEKIAYVCDSTSAPVSSLIIFNGWGALLLGLISTQIVEFNLEQNSIDILLHSLVYNFYAWITLIIVLIVILTQKDFYLMAQKEKEIKNIDINDKDIEQFTDYKGFFTQFIIPIITLIGGVFLSLYITGNGDFMNGSGSSAIFHSTFLTLFIMAIIYIFQKIYTLKTFMQNTMQGASNMLPIVILLILAFGMGKVTNELETGIVLSSLLSDTLNPALLPLFVFLISGVVSFSTGTSWGTFSIMMPIAIALAINLDGNIFLIIGAVISGGIFGDHASPISDTSIISSMAADCDHISHVQTQLPYAILSGLISSVLFLVFGYININHL